MARDNRITLASFWDKSLLLNCYSAVAGNTAESHKNRLLLQQDPINGFLKSPSTYVLRQTYRVVWSMSLSHPSVPKVTLQTFNSMRRAISDWATLRKPCLIAEWPHSQRRNIYTTNGGLGEWLTDRRSNHTRQLMRDAWWNTGPVRGMFCV